MAPVSGLVRYHLPRHSAQASCAGPQNIEAETTLQAVFDLAQTKRDLLVSTVDESGVAEAAVMGFALTPANEVVFDTLSTSRKAVNLARNPAAALVIGWDDNISLQIEGVARRPVGDDL